MVMLFDVTTQEGLPIVLNLHAKSKGMIYALGCCIVRALLP